MAFGADGTWNAATGNWSDPTKWIGAVPNAAGSTATFGTLSGTPVVTVDNAFTIGALRFDGTTTYQIVGTTPSGLTFDSGTSAPAEITATNASSSTNITIAAPLDLASDLRIAPLAPVASTRFLISGTISGNHALTKSDGGGVTLSGANTYAGVTRVEGGVLNVRHATGLGAGTGVDSDGTVVVSGATLQFTNPSQAAFNIANEKITLDGGILSGGTANLGGPVVLQTASEIVSGRIDGTISGGGALTLRSGATRLNGSNTYTGATAVTSGTTEVNHASGLGSASAATTVTGGTLNLNVGVGESIAVTGGQVNLLGGATHANAISVGNNATIGVGGGATLSSALTLTGGTAQVTSANATVGSRTIGGTAGSGDLYVRTTAGATIGFSGALSHVGNVRVNDANVNFAGGGALTGALQVESGIVNVQENWSIGGLSVNGGTINTSAGKTLTSAGTANLTSGVINASLAGADAVEKRGAGEASLKSLGGYAGPVRAQEGTLRVTGNSGLGSNAGNTYIAPMATVLLDAGVTVDDRFILDNSRGFGPFGAVAALAGSVTTDAVLAGDVELGTAGSTLGGTSGALKVNGAIHGGRLTSRGLKVGGAGHTYSGETTLEESSLILVDNGRLASTSGVVGGVNTGLVFDNRGVSLPDRLADSIPVTLRGGALSMSVRNGLNGTERIGALNVDRGKVAISLDTDTASTAAFTLGQLNHTTGSVLVFEERSFQLGAGQKVFVDGGPTLNDGIIGGWAVTKDLPNVSFATYDAAGVRRLEPYASNLNAGDFANVSLDMRTPVTMVGDRTVNALRTIFSDNPVNLGGNTLTLDTGGFIGMDATVISNGRIQPGAGSDGQLSLHVYGSGSGLTNDFSAAIVDRAGGAATTLVKSGAATLFLSGANTYSGPTTVAEGSLAIRSLAAFPSGGDLNLDGGAFFAGNDLGGTLEIGTLRLRGGELGGQGFAFNWHAQTIEVESGNLFAALTGNTALLKTGDGTVVLREDASGYSGPITIQRGTLAVGDGSSPSGSSANALGTGVTTVLPGGTLLNRRGAINGNITLAGGMLDADLPGSVSGGAGYGGHLDVTATSALNAARFSSNFAGPVDVRAGANLLVNGTQRVYFSGNLHVDGSIVPSAPGETIDVIALPGPTGTLSGDGLFAGSAQIGFFANLAPGGAQGDAVGALDVASGMWTASGNYEWQIADADGLAGADWDLLNVAGTLQLPSFGGDPFVVRVEGLGAGGAQGVVGDFDPHRSYAWVIASAANLGTFVPSAFAIDTTAFSAHNDLAGGTFSLSASGGNLMLNFTAVPEPSCAITTMAAVAALICRRRTRR